MSAFTEAELREWREAIPAGVPDEELCLEHFALKRLLAVAPSHPSVAGGETLDRLLRKASRLAQAIWADATGPTATLANEINHTLGMARQMIAAPAALASSVPVGGGNQGLRGDEPSSDVPDTDRQSAAEALHVEALAQFMHDEIETPDRLVDGQWPEHDGDDGYRGFGGWVKLQAKNVVAHDRENAARIWRFIRERLDRAEGTTGRLANQETAR